MKKFYFLLLIAFSYYGRSVANNPDYEARRTAYIAKALQNLNNDALTIQAYAGVPVDQSLLVPMLDRLRINMDVDFDIVKLIRILEFSHGEYDSQIVPLLDSIPFWLYKNEKLRVYWSENHMIMWMSSDWLMHEKYGRTIDSTLDKRLRHYLRLKIQYGFYEFFSTVYNPYCLSGLLNLADFAQDAEIKSLATQAAQRLLKEMLIPTTDIGVLFPAAGRNYHGKYQQPYNQNHSNLIYLLKGFGDVPGGASHAGGFLCTSSIPVDDIINSWTPNIDSVYHIGHTLQQGLVINQDMSANDRVIFQWSSGAYFHPDVAYSSAKLISEYNLWDHSEFSDFRSFAGLPISLAQPIADIASPISKSSVICGENVAVFKNKSVSLSSIQDFWKGKVGYQEFPVAAAVGKTAVYTSSGKVNPDWGNHTDLHANEHLPYVAQKKNVALVMYRPEKALAIFGHKDLNVALHFTESDFDEVREDGAWLLGRQGTSYVAVRRNCTDIINTVRACDNPDGQTWVIVVGNSDLHGSFDNFQSIIEQSAYEERWYFNLPTFQWVYYAKIIVDGKTIEYAWNGDIFSGPTRTTTGIINRTNTGTLKVYPNPVQDKLTMDLGAFYNHAAAIQVSNLAGERVYEYTTDRLTAPSFSIDTNTWAEGMYILTADGNGQHFTQKIIVKR
jgi:hypothetical protein